MDLELIEKYKRLFGIKVPTVEFSAKELKHRWRILCGKYHPDHGGRDSHFYFVQEAYRYLQPICKGKKVNKGIMFTSEIGEIKIPTNNGGFIYLWDVGEPDFSKQALHRKKFDHLYKGRNLNVKG